MKKRAITAHPDRMSKSENHGHPLLSSAAASAEWSSGDDPSDLHWTTVQKQKQQLGRTVWEASGTHAQNVFRGFSFNLCSATTGLGYCTVWHEFAFAAMYSGWDKLEKEPGSFQTRSVHLSCGRLQARSASVIAGWSSGYALCSNQTGLLRKTRTWPR